MSDSWETRLARWADEGLVDHDAVSRIVAWERVHGDSTRSRWPVRLALAFGGILISAGVLLFVAAHWDAIGPWQRFTVVLAAVGAFHLAGAAIGERFEALSATLHACGTVALGGGIFLAGQIFNLQEHWPTALLVWAAGAWIAWVLLRQWPQALLAAVITPAWLAGEWIVTSQHRQGASVAAAGVFLLALAYLGAEPGSRLTPAVRRALVWAGGLAVIPAALAFLLVLREYRHHTPGLRASELAVGWLISLGVPLALAWWLRGLGAIAVLAAALWVIAGARLAALADVLPYFWSAILSVGMVAWGITERRSERINLGVAGFALTVLVFYFSSVMDRLGRSASLIGLGLLFLGGGYVVERTRRRLVAQAAGGAG